MTTFCVYEITPTHFDFRFCIHCIFCFGCKKEKKEREKDDVSSQIVKRSKFSPNLHEYTQLLLFILIFPITCPLLSHIEIIQF